MVLLLTLLFVFLLGLVGEMRAARAMSISPTQFWRSPIMRSALIMLLMVATPWAFVRYARLGGVLSGDPHLLLAFSILLSFMISYTWYRYLTWLDPFERERRRHEAFVFLLACAITWKVPSAYSWVQDSFGTDLNGDAWNDWWYSVLVIGGLEESAKLLPLLAVWRLTRRVNEPYDFILYGSISALGFAFVENIHYLYDSALQAVMGRALMSSVMHMMLTSIMAYGLAIAVHRRSQGRAFALPLPGILFLLLVLAAVAHGFYDHWLLEAGRPRILSLLFFLASVQLWSIMKNNLVNLSPHFTSHHALPGTLFRYRIINGALAILAVGVVAVDLLFGASQARSLLLDNAASTALLLLVIAINFSNYAMIPGYVAPLRLPWHPLRWFLPKVDWEIDQSGKRITLKDRPGWWLREPFRPMRAMLPIEGVLERRVVVDGATDRYLFRPDRPMPLPGLVTDQFLIQLHRDHDVLLRDRYVVVMLAGLRQAHRADSAVVDARSVVPIHFLLAREEVPPPVTPL